VRSLRPGETPRSDWPETKILVPLDGSEIAEQVLPYVIQHATMSDSEVTLLRVGEAPVISSDYPEAAMHLSWEEHVARMTERYEEESRLYLQGVEKRLADAGLNVRSDSVLGNAAREIIDYAETNDFNLIAMTCHARFVIGAWPIGSVAEKVIHGSSTPVLVVRPR
jgi:nucleotide-binding universal stress UspA family protein